MDWSYFSDKGDYFSILCKNFIPNFKNCNSEKQFLDFLSTEIILKELVQFIYNRVVSVIFCLCRLSQYCLEQRSLADAFSNFQ